jgi:hypothetical protein
MYKCLRWSLLATALTLFMAGSTRADLLPPNGKPQPKRETNPLVILIDKDAKEVLLQIPRKFLEAAPPQSNLTPFRTIFAGLAMSLAIGSVFFVKRGSRLVRSSVVAVIAFATIFTAVGMLCADIRPPGGSPRRPRPRPANKPQADIILPAGTMIHNHAVIQVVPDGDELTLILPSRLQDKTDTEPGRAVPPQAPAAPSPTP